MLTEREVEICQVYNVPGADISAHTVEGRKPPDNSVDIDILLGSTRQLGRRIGPAALSLLAAELRQDAKVPMLGLTTSVRNERAHRSFERAGFAIARQYKPSGIGLCHLMLRDLRVER